VAGFSVLNSLHGGIRGAGDGLGKTWTILIAPAATVMAKRLSAKGFHRLESTICWSGALIAVLFLWRWGLIEPFISVKPRQVFHSNPGVSGMILIPAALFLLLQPRLSATRFLLWFLVASSIWLLNVRATIIPWFLVSFLGVTWLIGKGKRLIALIAVVPVLFLAMAFFQGSTDSWLRWHLFDLNIQSAIVHRLVIWSQVIAQFLDQPILGNGFNRYAIDLTVVAPEFHQYLVLGIHPHNGYLMTLHAVGVVGFFTLLGVIGYFFREVAFPNGSVATDRWRVVGGLSFLAMMIAGIADKMPYVTLVSIQVWLLVGIALARPVVAEKQSADPEVGG
jgi:O-antigen ligase